VAAEKATAAQVAAQEVAEEDTDVDHGGDGGCTANSCVILGIRSSFQEAQMALDAEINPLH
jgi:hypothetical protein